MNGDPYTRKPMDAARTDPESPADARPTSTIPPT